MSHIVDFHVEGLADQDKSFGQSLNRDVNIFFGLNGSGKTSLLKIFHSALSGNASIVEKIPFKRAELTIESLHFKKSFRYTLEKNPERKHRKSTNLSEFEEGGYNSDETQGIVYSSDGRIIRERNRELRWKIEPALPSGASGAWQHRFLPISRLMSQFSVTNRHRESQEDLYDTFFAHELERHWNGFFGSVQAEVRAIQEQGIADILTDLLSANTTPTKSIPFDWQKSYDRANAFLKRQKLSSALPSKKIFEERFRENPVLQRVVERIDDLEEKILKSMEKRTKLQSLIERLFSGGKRLVLGDTSVEVRGKNNTKISLQSLSSGEKHILRILFEVVSARRSSLIIDEPELSLHIEWQRELITSIMALNPDLQLIVATHSPEIMAEASDSKIFRIPN